MVKTFFLSIFLTSTLISCGELTGKSTGAAEVITSAENLIGGLATVQIEEGLYRFDGSAAGGGNSGHNFELKLHLVPGSEISFVFFGNKEMNRGYQLQLQNIDGKINATFALNGKAHQLELLPLEGQEIIHLDFDLHNDHSDIHALLWQHGGPYGDGDECTFNETCLYNSEDFAFDHWLGVGRAPGVFWGFRGNKNLILEVKGPRSTLSNI